MRIGAALVVVFGVTLVAILGAPYLEDGPGQAQIWNWFMDGVGLISLGVTLLILSDLEEMQSRFLLRARLPELQEDLDEKASQIGDILDETTKGTESRSRLNETLSRAEGVLKQIGDRTEGLDEVAYDRAQRLRRDIEDYRRTDEGELVDIWGDMHALNEIVLGLLKESEWRR